MIRIIFKAKSIKASQNVNLSVQCKKKKNHLYAVVNSLIHEEAIKTDVSLKSHLAISLHAI